MPDTPLPVVLLVDSSAFGHPIPLTLVARRIGTWRGLNAFNRHHARMVEKHIPVRVTFDGEANASYVYLADEPVLGWQHGRTVTVDADEIGGMVNFDLDTDGRLVGIEILDARSLLSDKLLAALRIR